MLKPTPSILPFKVAGWPWKSFCFSLKVRTVLLRTNPRTFSLLAKVGYLALSTGNRSVSRYLVLIETKLSVLRLSKGNSRFPSGPIRMRYLEL